MCSTPAPRPTFFSTTWVLTPPILCLTSPPGPESIRLPYGTSFPSSTKTPPGKSLCCSWFLSLRVPRSEDFQPWSIVLLQRDPFIIHGVETSTRSPLTHWWTHPTTPVPSSNPTSSCGTEASKSSELSKTLRSVRV